MAAIKIILPDTAIKVVIPAIEQTRIVVLKDKTRKVVKRCFIPGYLANPKRRMGSSANDKRLVLRMEKWKVHSKLILSPALQKAGFYKGKPIDESGWFVMVKPFHQDKIHCDGTNVLKAMEDILVWKSGNVGSFFLKDDKLMSGYYCEPSYDKENPRCEVTIVPPENFERM